jgi:hypothetical protein
MVKGDDVSPELFQVIPPSIEYSISIIGEPPFDSRVKITIKLPFIGVLMNIKLVRLEL